MPHQCVRCNIFYDDGAKEILEGCPCGARLFFYIKKEKLEAARKEIKELKLTQDDKKQIEEDVYELIGVEQPEDIPVILDFEAIRVLRPGKYELDLVTLFKGEPLIVKLEEGKYFIDVAETFRILGEGKEKK
ncbi:hypothetical protein J4410_01320 [Candidatus Woesearchaeota archaeon]|nr:hypothetical protein [Candidatus Woesearchaeota archaeon]